MTFDTAGPCRPAGASLPPQHCRPVAGVGEVYMGLHAEPVLLSPRVGHGNLIGARKTLNADPHTTTTPTLPWLFEQLFAWTVTGEVGEGSGGMGEDERRSGGRGGRGRSG